MIKDVYRILSNMKNVDIRINGNRDVFLKKIQILRTKYLKDSSMLDIGGKCEI